MAEGYLKFYGRGKVQCYSAGLFPTNLHPFAIQVMAEDNIDIACQESTALDAFRDQSFDYLLSFCAETSAQLPDYIRADQTLELFVPDPLAFEGDEAAQLEEFRRIRESIKTKILKFIGQELIAKEQLTTIE